MVSFIHLFIHLFALNQVFNALKEGTAALNKLHEELSVDDVEKLLDETMEAIEVQQRFYSYYFSILSLFIPYSVLILFLD